ncbi:ATP-dependent helicase [Herbivorax sp. ANBcel31]|uniref:ATP-dependent helicase n=1 Tax=Herbivorax sp. ANBcel31 TaxID=3069754 RepID=UPI0027B7562F|nr:ATP-dependent helicase [Herbivorax sp. ANBcel31]MDQ2086210.1 ATP-dependent helicase [Herbivorax sp. ANBcel31]
MENFFDILEKNYKISLNDQQKEAVTHTRGPALVLAGPGSGKTTVITSRTAYLISELKIKPENILTMTFNRAAKIEMEKRFNNIFKDISPRRVHFSTLHSFCNLVVRDYENIRRKYLERIEGKEETKNNKRIIIKDIYKNVNGTKINEDELEELINEIGLVKNKMIKDLEKVDTSIKNFPNIYKYYEEHKKTNLLMDFDDMLTFAYKILEKFPGILKKYIDKYNFIQVDEGQDLSKIQFEILKLLVSSKEKNIFLVADDDQSIYRFRGAEPEYILSMKEQFRGCSFYYLSNNYRSTANIVNISSRFIKNNTRRYDKKHCTFNEYRHDPFIVKAKDQSSQYKFVVDKVEEYLSKKKNSTIAILYRNNISSIPLAEALDRNKIDFNVKQNRLFFFNHWVVQDILSFLKFSLDQTDADSFWRIYYRMNRYISKAMLEYALNVGYKDSIIDGILKDRDIKSYKKMKLLNVKSEFKKLSKKRPYDALKYIEKDFNYFDYVKEYCENTGLFYDYLYSLFGVLKVISLKYKKITDYLQRIEEIKKLLENTTSGARLTMSTIHSSKGLEYDCVIMVDMVNSELPGESAIDLSKEENNKDVLEEERRLFYVGITRAKEHLYLIYPNLRNGFMEERTMFIDEILDCVKKKNLNDITEGVIVTHKHFGKGVIAAILEEKKDSIIVEIDFNGIRRKLDLVTCLEKELLKL